MKTIQRIFFLFIFLFCGICAASAAGNATITVHVNSKEFMSESLILTLQDEYIYNEVGAKELYAKANAKGDFVFRLNNLNSYKIYRLEFADFPFIFSYVEPGDQIKIDFSGSRKMDDSKDDYSFSGKGSEKLMLWHKITYHPSWPLLLHPVGKSYDHRRIDSLIARADEIYGMKMKMLSSMGKGLSKDMRQMFQGEMFASAYRSVLSCFDYDQEKVQLDSTKVSYLLRQIAKRESGLSPKIIAENPVFLRYMVHKSRVVARYRKGVNRQNSYSYTFSDLIGRNTGLLREKALLLFISDDNRHKYDEHPERIYRSALSFMSNKKHRAYIDSIIGSRKVGAPAYDFSMTDVNGDTVRLHDFRNKVVVIETWFTGCGSCSSLAGLIRSKVLPSFIDNPDVVFMTVSVDRSRQLWLDSVHKGDYTNSKDINLFTEGLGTNHPFMQYYHFRAMPQLLLIDKNGKLVSTDIRGTAEEISAKINKALAGK
jgi:hypothetical protein